MENFICSGCGKQEYIPKFKIKIGSIGPIYSNNGVELVCSHCHSILKPIEKEGEYNVTLGSFHMLNRNGKANVLKERSKQHYKKNIKEKQLNMLKNK